MIGGIPAIACVRDAGRAELSVAVALWPTSNAEQSNRILQLGFRVGEVHARGWLEREWGRWLQCSPRPTLRCRRDRAFIVASLKVAPMGYRDEGPF